MKAVWNNETLAESKETIVIEGNHYFPPDSVNLKFFKDSEMTSVCPWKGDAKYYNIEVDDQINENGAWYYPEPKQAAKEIKNYVAFWNGVEISE